MSVDWIGRFRALTPRVHGFVQGRLVDGRGEPISKLGPRDGRLLYKFSDATRDDVNEAVAAARRAFEDGRWSKLPVSQRKVVLHRLAGMIEKHANELALFECLDVGKPISDAVGFDVPAAAALIRHSAEALDGLCGSVYTSDDSNISYKLHRPLGVVAGIVGWNFPLLLAAGKVGPVLATGNSLVLKPSELTAMSAGRLAQLAAEAGVPEGVFNVINGGPEVGAALTAHPDIDLVTFTGSTRTGKSVLIASGQSNMKRTILECGGKSPNIVFDDCPNLDGVADAIVRRAFWNQGQVCTASSRALIQDSVKDKLLPLIVARAKQWTFGDPLKEETTFGAVVSRTHEMKVRQYADGAANAGLNLAYRSNSPPPFKDGFYIPPTIFVDVTSDRRLAQEEIFGPILAVMTFSDVDEAIRIANDTVYGLSAIVWTRSLERANRATQGIKAGWITVNATDKPRGGPGAGVLPVEGHKESGFGIEGGIEGLKGYTSNTAVQWFV